MTSTERSSRGSLARQFAASAVALATVAVLLIAAGSWWWIDRLQQGSARALQQRDVELGAARVAEALGRVEARLREIADSPLLSTALTDSLGREAYLLPYLGGIQSIDGVPVELLLVDFEGKEIARNGDLSFTDAQRQALQGPVAAGRQAALVSTEPRAQFVLLGVPVRYPRTQTVEGAVWVKLRLDDLPSVAGHVLRVGAGHEPLPEGRLRAVAALPPSMAALDLAVEQAAAPPRGVDARAYALSLALGTALLVVAIGLAALRMARRLTADLSALDRFANSVAGNAAVSERAAPHGADEVAGLAASINRMLDRLQQQHEALQSEAKSQLNLLATCISHLHDVVMITESDPDPAEGHRIVFVNPAFTRMTGYASEEVIGRGPKLLQGPETDAAELHRIGQHLRHWKPVRAEVLNYSKTGERYWVEMEIAPIKDPTGWVTHWVSVERDVTARREAEATRLSLEQQVRESQKMEAIGTLAGGIAHDFNNILGAMLGNVALAKEDLATGQSPAGRLEQIGQSARRARSLVQQILTYSRRQQQVRSPQDLCALVQEATALLRATVPARAELRSRLPARAVIVDGDATELVQVLVNLGTNAWQSLASGGGHIEIGLEVADGAVAPPADGTAPAATRHAHMWVADDGCGMAPDTLARVFEPFFTTKPVGVGTGLGLSVVQGIVRSHGGTITVDSAPGQGSRFHVRLPLAPQAASAGAPVPAAEAAIAPRGHGERVLYVDDDDVMLAVAAALLERWGYRVTTARDAAEALEIVRGQPGGFDLVITDFNMPGLSGVDVLRELRKLRPTLPVILTSGFVSEEMLQEAMTAGASRVVRKENLQDELAAEVAQVLRDATA